MSREPSRPISRAISVWLRTMGEPGYDAYNLHALRTYLHHQRFPAEAIETELELWLRYYIKAMAPGSRAFTLSPEGEALIDRFRRRADETNS